MTGSLVACRRGCLVLALFGAITGSCINGGEAVDEAATEAAGDTGSSEDAPRLAAASAPGGEHPLAPAIRIAQGSLMRLQSIQDYETTLVKSERADGRFAEHTMHMKLREKPLSIYLKYGEPFVGRELLFVEGSNENRVLAHGASGSAPPMETVSLELQDSLLMRENRYPITEFGMRQMLEKVIGQWKLESLYGEIDVQFFPDARLRGQPCEVIESTHPRPRRQFKFQKTRLYVDAQSRLPIRIEQHAFPNSAGQEPTLDEIYEYVNLRTNVGLTDEDFDPRNPKYSF